MMPASSAAAGILTADASVLTSVTGQVPVLSTAEDASLVWKLAGSYSIVKLECSVYVEIALNQTVMRLQEPIKTYNASEYCGSRHPYGRHAFAGNAAADAFVLTSLTGQVPVLSTAEDAGFVCKLAGSHKLPVTAVDWHPQMNVVISASADCSTHISYLDL